MRKRISEPEENLAAQIRIRKLPAPVREYRFHPTRKWRFDFAWVEQKLAVEVEGGAYASGRHTRGKGFEDDCLKYNSATLLGWRVLRYTPKSMTWTHWTAVDEIAVALGIGVGSEEQPELQQLGLRACGLGG